MILVILLITDKNNRLPKLELYGSKNFDPRFKKPKQFNFYKSKQ